MKRIHISCAILLVLLVGAMPLVAQDVSKLKYPKLNEIDIPQVQKITLDNGIRLYVLEDPSLPIVRASVRLNCGAYLEPPSKVGLASIFGQVLRTGGTQKRSGDEIDALLEGIGASVETSVGNTSGSASMFVLQENLDTGLEVLADVLRNPVFNQDKIDLVKVGQRSAISRRNDEPFSIAIREFIKTIYGKDSPYARQTEYATVDAVTREDLVSYHQAFMHPENVQIALWGAITKDQAVSKVNQYFGDWAKGNAPVPPLPKVEYQFEPRVYYIEKPDVNQSNILVGHIGGLLTDPDYAALVVMNNILGGSFASRLFNNVRSKEGLAYSTSGSYTANILYPGIFYSFASTKSETTGKAIKEVIKQIKSMQTDPATPAEMSIGRDGYLNSFVFNFEDRAQVINRMMSYDFYGLPEDFLFKEKEQVEKVTPDAVMAAAQKNLKPDMLRVVVVGKGSDFETPLDQLGLGPVDTVDIAIPSGEAKQELAVTPENLAKGKELLAKAVAAHGGSKAFKAVKSIMQKGTTTIVTPNGEFPLAVESIYEFPDKSREAAEVFGRKIVDIRNGSSGWKTNQADPAGGMIAKTEEDIANDDKEIQRNTILLLARSDKGDMQSVYAGDAQVDGVTVSRVAILGADGKPSVTLGINPESGQLVTKEYWGQGMMGEGNIQEVYSDFKKTGGVLLPMNTVRNIDGQKAMVIAVTECTVNGAIPAGSFEKPQM